MPFIALTLLLLVDLIFNVVENSFGQIDLFDLDEIPGSGIILPPILSKVPLMLALCLTFFVATISSFYLSGLTQDYFLEGSLFWIDIICLPLILYFSLAVSAWLLKPLAPLFDKSKAFAKVQFVGLVAHVHSSQVNQESGEIKVLQGGNEYLLDATTELDASFNYGDEVVIVGKQSDTHRYIITKK